MTALLPAQPATPAPARAVVDCPAIAWDDSDQPARLDIGRDFYSLYSGDLDAAAHDLIRPHLVAAWRKRGLTLRVLNAATWDGERRPDDPDDETYWAVRQEAANQLHGHELIFRAGLTEQYAAYQD